MFCPQCGIQENQPKQFCRACGTNLHIVRTALENPSELMEGTMSARENIGRAVALKIKELKSAKDLSKITEEVLPELEKFLATPAEKRLRRLRTGVMTATIGVAAIITGLVLANITRDNEWGMLAAMGFIPFLIGLGIVLNGLYFSGPRKRLPESFDEIATPNSLSQFSPLQVITNDLQPPETIATPPSITDHTTHKLAGKVHN